MREVELVLPHTVMGHEEPASAPLFHTVQSVAYGRLHNLRGERLRVSNDPVVKGAAPVHLTNERVSGHGVGFTIRDLHDHFTCGEIVAEEHARAEHTFVADRGNLRHATVIHHLRQ